MGKRLLFVLAVSLFLVPLSAQQDLAWSLALIKGGRGLDFSRPVEMEEGDVFSLAIVPRQDCYAYIVIQESDRVMSVILDRGLQAEEEYSTGSIRLTPPSGSETFYIVISRTEQKNLRAAIDAYVKQNNSRTSRGLTTAVMEIRRSVSRLKENPEKPVAMGGAFRGTGTNGTEYSGAGVYVKTIIINH
ncbi:MAG: DUF4384 domain-containing protein [Treponema sp.]|jgi:hypothetical protein|nr:DUF4384 domain-containing protein [Treponema sp.]